MKKIMSAYIRVREDRGQVPGTTCNGARTNQQHPGLKLYKGIGREWRGVSVPST